MADILEEEADRQGRVKLDKVLALVDGDGGDGSCERYAGARLMLLLLLLVLVLLVLLRLLFNLLDGPILAARSSLYCGFERRWAVK